MNNFDHAVTVRGLKLAEVEGHLQERAGRLAISPQGVMSASEVLSATAAVEMEAAWGAATFDVYAATEAAGIASPCSYRNSHVYEDLVIVEPVDQDGVPVPPGTIGARLLVTVMFSRTLPLIRYEMSHRVGVGGRGCPCLGGHGPDLRRRPADTRGCAAGGEC